MMHFVPVQPLDKALSDHSMPIDGSLIPVEERERIVRSSPAHRQKDTRYPLTTKENVENAVRAARKAFDHGVRPNMPASAGAGILLCIAEWIGDCQSNNILEFALWRLYPPLYWKQG